MYLYLYGNVYKNYLYKYFNMSDSTLSTKLHECKIHFFKSKSEAGENLIENLYK